MMRGVGKVSMTESLENLDFSKILIVTSQNIILFHDVISSNKYIIHRNEEIDGYVNQVKLLQIVHRPLCPILFQILNRAVVIRFKSASLPNLIEVCA